MLVRPTLTDMKKVSRQSCLAKQKRKVLWIFFTTLFFWIATLVIRRNGYVPKFSSNKIFWATGHFAQYAILGYFAPDLIMTSWLIGFGFELFEYFGQMNGWPFLVGKVTDPLVNAFGLCCGYLLLCRVCMYCARCCVVSCHRHLNNKNPLELNACPLKSG